MTINRQTGAKETFTLKESKCFWRIMELQSCSMKWTKPSTRVRHG